MDRTRLSRAIRGAIATAAVSTSFTALPLATLFFANLSHAQEVEEVVVTGTRILRTTDATSATPISVFDASMLENSGQITLEDFLQDMPSMTGGQLGSSVNNGNPGLATVSLRGLGASRTLVLLNGRRIVSVGASTGTVDLNTIPISAIERIEVLRDGASTIYGSDAIAGVVNIITKTNFEGAELRADYGVSTHGDGEEYLAAITFGGSTEKGHVMLNAEYNKRNGVFQGARGFSDCPLFEAGGTIFCGGSGATTPAQFFRPGISGGFIVDPTTGVPRPYSAATDAFNYAEVSYLVTPQEVFSIYGYGEHELWDIKDVTTIEAFGEVLFANRRSDQLMASEATFWGAPVPGNHPDNPFPGEDLVVVRRLQETGGRQFIQDVNTWRSVLGIKGIWCNDWNWDISYNYGRWVDPRINTFRGNVERINRMLDPVACAADPACAAAVAPGTAWNPFANNTLTPEMQAYGLVNVSPITKSTLRSLQANLVGDFGGYGLTSEPFQWAIGYEHRSERADITADSAASLGQAYFVTGEDWGGSYKVDEVYGEIRLPLMEGRPGVDLLAVEASFRYSDYNTIGSDTVFGGVVEYAPLEQLRFRATYSEGFRSPSIADQFLPPTLSAQRYTDPCFEPTNPTVIANCNADGVPPDLNTISGGPQATGILGGNPDLKAEESESWTLGMVWTPTFIEDLSFSFDYFRIRIDDAIGSFTTDAIVNTCYSSPGFSDPTCALITGPAAIGAQPFPGGSPRRQANGTIAGQLLTAQNVSTFKTDGVDLGLNYSMGVGPGTVTLTALATYLHEWKYQATEFDPEIDLAGKFGEDPVTGNIVAFPEWKFFFTADYELDYWAVGTTVRAIGPVDDILGPGGNELSTHVDTTWYQDVRASYFCWENVKITGGIRNVWNQKPPYVTNYDDMNTLPLNYDTIGRFFYGSVTLSF